MSGQPHMDAWQEEDSDLGWESRLDSADSASMHDCALHRLLPPEAKQDLVAQERVAQMDDCGMA